MKPARSIFFTLPFVGVGAHLLVSLSCAYRAPLYCDESTPCEDPVLYCDLAGRYPASEGIGNTCIPNPFDAGAGYDSIWDASAEPSLSALEASVGHLEPAFDPLIVDYALKLPLGAEQVAFTPTAGDPRLVTVRINGSVVPSGTASDGIELGGEATIDVVVEVPGQAPVTYQIRPIHAAAIAQRGYLKASNTDPADRFGYRIAATPDTIVVGAYREASGAIAIGGDQSDNLAPDAGAVYVYTLTGDAWSQQAYLKGSNSAAGALFGISLAIESNTLVVGASDEPGGGSAYVFVRTGTTWVQQARLQASNRESGDGFGQSVALSGDTIVVGAGSEDSASTGIGGNETNNSASGAGAAYVFTRSGTSWSQQAYLKASNTGPGDSFGAHVAVFGNTLAVGAWSEDSAATGVDGLQLDDSASYAGAVYVFTRSGSIWSQQAYVKASNTGAGDYFGASFDLDGDILAVGAYGEASGASDVGGDETDNGAAGAGAVYIFQRTGAVWTQQSYVKATNASANDHFGDSVALDGAILAVGASGESSGSTSVGGDEADDSQPGAGAAYVFRIKDGTWSQRAYVKASNAEAGDRFGYRVAVARGVLAVGAWAEDGASRVVDGVEGDNAAAIAGASYAFR